MAGVGFEAGDEEGAEEWAEEGTLEGAEEGDEGCETLDDFFEIYTFLDDLIAKSETGIWGRPSIELLSFIRVTYNSGFSSPSLRTSNILLMEWAYSLILLSLRFSNWIFLL